jgi:N4-(beta-N-acetylglucosaminyl)-L-asparaginase
MEYDAAAMCGATHRLGAVLAVPRCCAPVRLARAVLERSPHNVLVGEGAMRFAERLDAEQSASDGARSARLLDSATVKPGLHPRSRAEYDAWRERRTSTTGAHAHQTADPVPDSPTAHARRAAARARHRDTIGLIARDARGNLACATSTTGWAFASPGRVGDAPLVGGGFFVDNAVGAAVATGDGEEIMKSCLSVLAVEGMRRGLDPSAACREALSRMLERISDPAARRRCTVGMVAMTSDGDIGGASTISPENPHHQPSSNPDPHAFQFAELAGGGGGSRASVGSAPRVAFRDVRLGGAPTAAGEEDASAWR